MTITGVPSMHGSSTTAGPQALAPPAAVGAAVFDTAIGPMGIAWSDDGVVGLQLPEGDAAATARRLRRRYPEAAPATVPPSVQPVVDGVVRLLAGEQLDLAGVPLDMSDVGDFDRAVYTAVQAVPPGSTTTYGEVAGAIGSPGAARGVGQSLGRNPFPVVVPCHRVVAAGGRIGGFSAHGGLATKRRMLAIEGALLLSE